MSGITPNRRTLGQMVAGAGTLFLTGCDQLSHSMGVQHFIGGAEGITTRIQRALLAPGQLAPEFKEADISPKFKANGTLSPDDDAYRAHVAAGFKDWKLQIGGLVEHPMSLSLPDLHARTARTQITRHDCVEGWSCIGKWTGPQLGPILKEAKLKPNARYIVFRCADALEASLDGSGQYYESIGLADAFHPQTILAYSLNDKPLEVSHGAPLRLRVERQLGYKQAKYLMKIEAVESYKDIAGGRGGYWPDRGYEWYAGI